MIGKSKDVAEVGQPLSIAGCPTKRAMPRLIVGQINPACVLVQISVYQCQKWNCNIEGLQVCSQEK